MKNFLKRFKENNKIDIRVMNESIAHKNKVEAQAKIWRDQAAYPFIAY